MNVLFMTIGKMDNVEEHTIYCDLLRYFRDAGHSVYTISPYEKEQDFRQRMKKKWNSYASCENRKCNRNGKFNRKRSCPVVNRASFY